MQYYFGRVKPYHLAYHYQCYDDGDDVMDYKLLGYSIMAGAFIYTPKSLYCGDRVDAFFHVCHLKIKRRLKRMGLIDAPEACELSWRNFKLDFWNSRRFRLFWARKLSRKKANG